MSVKSIHYNGNKTASNSQLKYLADIERKLNIKYYGDYSTWSVSEFITKNKEAVQKWDREHYQKYNETKSSKKKSDFSLK